MNSTTISVTDITLFSILTGTTLLFTIIESFIIICNIVQIILLSKKVRLKTQDSSFGKCIDKCCSIFLDQKSVTYNFNWYLVMSVQIFCAITTGIRFISFVLRTTYASIILSPETAEILNRIYSALVLLPFIAFFIVMTCLLSQYFTVSVTVTRPTDKDVAKKIMGISITFLIIVNFIVVITTLFGVILVLSTSNTSMISRVASFVIFIALFAYCIIYTIVMLVFTFVIAVVVIRTTLKRARNMEDKDAIRKSFISISKISIIGVSSSILVLVRFILLVIGVFVTSGNAYWRFAGFMLEAIILLAISLLYFGPFLGIVGLVSKATYSFILDWKVNGLQKKKNTEGNNEGTQVELNDTTQQSIDSPVSIVVSVSPSEM